MVKELSFMVTGQSIDLAVPAMLVAGTVGEYTARFAFDADWDGYQRIAVFSADGVEREQLLTDDACDVPWEVLRPGAYLKVGVYGTRDGSRLPTIWTAHRQYIHDGAGPTDEAADPSPVLAEQMLQRMGDLGQLQTEDKSSLVAAINEVRETGGGGGTSDHSKLANRDAADQHPMSAITGLEDALAGKQPTGNYLTEEQDPTVPDWAKRPQKPAYTAQEVGALPAATHIPSTAADVNAEPSGAVSQHNTAADAHNDIRLLIQGLTDRLNALADSDDTTLDQLSEVVAYIKSNRDLISAITTDKVSVADIVDDLVTNVADKPLSAAQGVALKALIDAISIPDKLPNPNALTFTGAVEGSYDGSEAKTINIPSGGGEPEYDYEKFIVLGEAVTSYIIDTFDDGTPLALSSLEVISVSKNNTASTVNIDVLTDLPNSLNAGKLNASTIGGYTGAEKWMYLWLEAKIKNGECRADFASKVSVPRYVNFYSGILFDSSLNYIKLIPAITYSNGTTEIFPNKATKFTSVEISVPKGSMESGSMIRIRGVKA